MKEGERPSGLLHGEVTQVILGAFYSVHSELGYGFLEAVYGRALEVVLRTAGLDVRREVPFEIGFRGHAIGTYRADMIVESKVVVEVKAWPALVPAHCAQVLNYLRASGIEVGLLLNFGHSAQFRRVIATRSAKSASAKSA